MRGDGGTAALLRAAATLLEGGLMASRASKKAAAERLSRVSRKATDTVTQVTGAYAMTRLAVLARQPSTGRYPTGSWTLANIFAARDAQMQGNFERAVRLAEGMRTFPELHVARTNRLEAQKSITSKIEPAGDTGRARAIAAEAEALYGPRGIGVTAGTKADIEGYLVDHGIAIGLNTPVIRADASRVDLVHTCWPLEFVKWDAFKRRLVTRIDGGAEVPIVHGDGRWVVYAKHDDMPWRQDAAVLSGSLVWAYGAHAKRDMAKASVSHGNAKVIGELPAGVSLQSDEGTMTDEATAFLELLRAVANDDSPIGIAPAGSKLNYLVNTSQAWQIWKELIGDAAKAAARIYLGTDGVLGSQGGAPGVDVNALFGVARTRVEGDLHCIENGFYTGVLIPWTLLNFGDAAPAPRLVYQIPDVDADAAVESLAKRRTAFFADVASMREQGFGLTQAAVDAIAERYQVDAPTLAALEAQAPSVALAPTDLFGELTPNEVRGTAGVGPLMLPDGSRDPDGDVINRKLAERREQEKIAAQQRADMEAEAAKIAAEAAAEQEAAPAPAEPLAEALVARVGALESRVAVVETGASDLALTMRAGFDGMADIVGEVDTRVTTVANDARERDEARDAREAEYNERVLSLTGEVRGIRAGLDAANDAHEREITTVRAEARADRAEIRERHDTLVALTTGTVAALEKTVETLKADVVAVQTATIREDRQG